MKEKTLEQLLNELPKTRHYRQAFGLMLCVVYTDNSRKWQCKYYSHFSNTTDTSLPECVAKSPRVAVKKMIRIFQMTDKQIMSLLRKQREASYPKNSKHEQQQIDSGELREIATATATSE